MGNYSLKEIKVGEKGAIYSVISIDSECEESEFESFILKFKGSEYQDDLNQILKLLDIMATKEGFKDCFFRSKGEGAADAIPPDKANKQPEDIDFEFDKNKLRLYCFRFSENTLILFNGGNKDSAIKAQDSKGTSMKFQEAQSFVAKICEYRKQQGFTINHRGIIKNINEIVL